MLRDVQSTEFLLDGKDWKLIHLVPREWEHRKVWEENWAPGSGMPAAPDWLKGTVPGDAISDAVDAGLVPPPFMDMNSRSCEWLSQRDWVYRKDFAVPPEMRGKQLRLQFDGVDFGCYVYLNGKLLGSHEGMFESFSFDVTESLNALGNNWLVVVVDHAPAVDQVQGQIGRTSQARVWKSRFAYNWDWCTRLVPVGIWQSVKLQATGEVRIENLWIRSSVEGTTATLGIALDTSESTIPAEVALKVLDPSGKEVACTTGTVKGGSWKETLAIPNPQLWWPNGMGEQPLYTVSAEILVNGKVSDSTTSTCGLRRVRMVANDNASTDALPYTPEINGKRMFIKGWNWVPQDQMYGRVQPERYERLLQLAKHAHCNFLRVWGGGLLERKKFYDLCDRLGIVVWQEFMQSSSGIDNRPPTDEEYLRYIERQARIMVLQRRNHPSLIIWCGGNELMDDHANPLDSSHPALAVLHRVVSELDPDRAWLPTSASGPSFCPLVGQAGNGKMHDVHGPWKYDGAESHYRMFNTTDQLLHSEFGCEGSANLFTLKKFISPELLWPPDQTNPAWVHHASWWLHKPRIEELFGPVNNIEEFVKLSQLMQAEGLRYGIEANRRRKWHCSGTIPWQFNEAFPNAACTNSVDYLTLPKPVYWWVRRAYEPVHISMSYAKLGWKPGETWTGDIHVNNSGEALQQARWTAVIMDLDGKKLLESTGQQDIPANSSMKLGGIEYAITSSPLAALVFLELWDGKGGLLSSNEYFFSNAERPLQPFREAPPAQIDVSRKDDKLQIRNVSNVPALFVQFEPDGELSMPSEDYIIIAPNQSALVSGKLPLHPVVRGWNTN